MQQTGQQQQHPIFESERVNGNTTTTRSAHDEAIIVRVHQAEFQIIHHGGIICSDGSKSRVSLKQYQMMEIDYDFTGASLS